MCFYIRLVAYHEAIFVTHLIKIRCIWIMTGTDRIEVVLFHKGKILFYLLHIHCKAGYRIRIVPVDTAEFDLLSIEVNNFILYLYRSDSDMINDRLIFTLQNEGIQIWILGVPKCRLYNLKCESSVMLCLSFRYNHTILVFDRNLNRCLLIKAQIELHLSLFL